MITGIERGPKDCPSNDHPLLDGDDRETSRVWERTNSEEKNKQRVKTRRGVADLAVRGDKK